MAGSANFSCFYNSFIATIKLLQSICITYLYYLFALPICITHLHYLFALFVFYHFYYVIKGIYFYESKSINNT